VAGGVQAGTVKRVTLHVLDITAVDLVQIYGLIPFHANGPAGLAGNGAYCPGMLRLHTDSAAAETRAKEGRNNGKGVIVPCPIVVSIGKNAEIPSGVTGNVVDFPAKRAIITLDGWQHRQPSRA
jgi:hypothetical protein